MVEMRCNEGKRLRSFQASGVIGDVPSGVTVHDSYVDFLYSIYYLLLKQFGYLFLMSISTYETKNELQNMHKIISIQSNPLYSRGVLADLTSDTGPSFGLSVIGGELSRCWIQHWNCLSTTTEYAPSIGFSSAAVCLNLSVLKWHPSSLLCNFRGNLQWPKSPRFDPDQSTMAHNDQAKGWEVYDVWDEPSSD